MGCTFGKDIVEAKTLPNGTEIRKTTGKTVQQPRGRRGVIAIIEQRAEE